MTEPKGSGPYIYRHADGRWVWGALHKADVPGFIRAGRPSVQASNHKGRLVLLPRGQGGPPHSSTGDHIIIQLEGEAEFLFPRFPDETFRLSRFDVIYIPADTEFEYRNVGDTDTLWFTTVGKGANHDWPPVASYEGGEVEYSGPRLWDAEAAGGWSKVGDGLPPWRSASHGKTAE